MRIDLNSPLTGAQAEHSGKPSSAPKARRVQVDDNATLSHDTVTVSSLAAKALETPEVRQDRVESLRQAVQNGTYSVNPQDIAEAILAYASK